MTGLELRQKREQLELTVAQFAERLGMDGRIVELEEWEANPDITACPRCPRLLEIAVASLLGADITDDEIDLISQSVDRMAAKKLGDILKDFDYGAPDPVEKKVTGIELQATRSALQLSVDELAVYLQINSGTIYVWEEAGESPCAPYRGLIVLALQKLESDLNGPKKFSLKSALKSLASSARYIDDAL